MVEFVSINTENTRTSGWDREYWSRGKGSRKKKVWRNMAIVEGKERLLKW